MGLAEELAASFQPNVAEVIASATRSAPFSMMMGLEVIEQGPGLIRCRLPTEERHQNGVGLVHGGTVVSLIDHVLSVVVYPHIEPGKWAATLDLSVSYVAPVRKGELIAEARITSLRTRIGTVRIEVMNRVGEAESLVATAMGTVYIKERPS